LHGSNDVFAAKLSASGSDLLWSTLLGEAATEYSDALALLAGDVMLTGFKFSDDFPTTDAAYDRTRAGSSGVFVARFKWREPWPQAHGDALSAPSSGKPHGAERTSLRHRTAGRYRIRISLDDAGLLPPSARST
jgi:hypothetical protein